MRKYMLLSLIVFMSNSNTAFGECKPPNCKAEGAHDPPGAAVTQPAQLKKIPPSEAPDKSGDIENLTSMELYRSLYPDLFLNPPEVRRLSIQNAIHRAFKRNPEVIVANLKRKDAELRYRAEKRNLMPRVNLEATWLRWDSALPLELGISAGAPPEDCPLSCLVFLGDMFSNMGNLREQYTQNYKVQVVQPLTATWAVLQLVKARKVDMDVSSLENQLSHETLKYKIVVAYINVLQAQAYAEIAEKSENLIRSHLTNAQAFNTAEMLPKVELSRLKTTLGKALQQTVSARSSVALAMDVLKMHLGDNGRDTFELTNRFSEPLSLVRLPVATALQMMEKNRVELLNIRNRHRMLDHAIRASTIAQLPNANIILQYDHNEGLGSLQPKNAWFIGVNLSFQWDWNKKNMETDLLRSQKLQLDAVYRQTSDLLGLSVKKQFDQVRLAWNKIRISKLSLSEAEEVLRLEGLQFKSEMKTTISLLDAQTRWDAASFDYTNSVFEYYLNLAGLMYSIGVSHLEGSELSW
ncbi:TolC family protein [Myxococcota bacterium]|nr:TolC family protein [Myxococcota bacterium]